MQKPEWLEKPLDNGSLLALSAVGLVALAGAVTSGDIAKVVGSTGLGATGGGNRGSASNYTDFMSEALPRLRKKGHSAQQAMSLGAAEWRAKKGK
jgi:hypothetical protein